MKHISYYLFTRSNFVKEVDDLGIGLTKSRGVTRQRNVPKVIQQMPIDIIQMYREHSQKNVSEAIENITG